MEISIAECKREQREFMRREHAQHNLESYVLSALDRIQSIGAFRDAKVVIAYDPINALEIPYIETLKNNHADKVWYVLPRRVEDEKRLFSDLHSFIVPYVNEAIVLLVPSLAVDESGNRLGKGGGFYDRLIHLFPNFITISVVPDFARILICHELHDKQIMHPLFAVVS